MTDGDVDAPREGTRLFMLDGEGVLLSEAANELSRLSPLGVLVWQCMERGAGADGIARAAADAFDLPTSEALAAVRSTLTSFREHGLVAGARSQQSGSPETARLERAINVCARHQLPVFLLGPSGTGKTHVARFIHEASRRKGQFILVNCGRLPTDPVQLQSELLGHARGAFTGATADRIGKFHAADGGTLFLDEVEYLPRAAQDFLIDLLDGSGSFAPLGAPATRHWSRPEMRLIPGSDRSRA